MSQWQYLANRRIVLQNIANGDFSNCATFEADTPEKRKKLREYANKELSPEVLEEKNG